MSGEEDLPRSRAQSVSPIGQIPFARALAKSESAEHERAREGEGEAMSDGNTRRADGLTD